MDIHKIQIRLLEMGKEIARILEDNQIPYIICFGTLLGAIRHKGFIPWDDDFDFILFDDTYKKATDILQAKLPKDCFLENEETEPLYFHAYAHVKDVNSIATCSHFPQDSLYSHKGLSIDLYKAVKIKEKDLNSFILNEHISYLQRRVKIGSISEDSFLKRKEEIIKCNENEPVSDSNKMIFGMALPEKYMNIENVFPLKKYQFEDTEFWGPAKYDELLKSFYGNYMEFPPIAERAPHYDSVVFI